MQALGEKLVELSADQIKKIDMPMELRDALFFAKTINKGEARRRQLQYIGVLMRKADPGPFRRLWISSVRDSFRTPNNLKNLNDGGMNW